MKCPHCQKPFRIGLPALAPDKPSKPPRLDVGGVTLTGRKRERNEDALLIRLTSWTEGEDWHDAALLVIADGMGGYQAGEQAAQMTIRAVGHALDFLFDGALVGKFRETPLQQIAETLEFALLDVHRQLYQRSQRQPELRGMGATVVAALIWMDKLLICHVGDTRVYLCRHRRWQQITKDQTLVARMVELGQLTPEEAKVHPQRNEVSQALGKHPTLEPARYQISIQAGDWIVLASDGLHSDLDETVLPELVIHFRGSARDLASHLAEAANAAGGSDNISVIVAGYH